MIKKGKIYMAFINLRCARGTTPTRSCNPSNWKSKSNIKTFSSNSEKFWIVKDYFFVEIDS